jgi:hypothetical protein
MPTFFPTETRQFSRFFSKKKKPTRYVRQKRGNKERTKNILYVCLKKSIKQAKQIYIYIYIYSRKKHGKTTNNNTIEKKTNTKTNRKEEEHQESN